MHAQWKWLVWLSEIPDLIKVTSYFLLMKSRVQVCKEIPRLWTWAAWKTKFHQWQECLPFPTKENNPYYKYRFEWAQFYSTHLHPIIVKLKEVIVLFAIKHCCLTMLSYVAKLHWNYSCCFAYSPLILSFHFLWAFAYASSCRSPFHLLCKAEGNR